jgi:putative endonuclease
MTRTKMYYVYILSSLSGTLYIGITSNLEKRMAEHKEGMISGFTKQYSVHRLVYFEGYDDVRRAIAREKQLKGWRREKQIALIEEKNPRWKDLAKAWYESRGPSTRDRDTAAVARSG